jgi:hypothetical protein
MSIRIFSKTRKPVGFQYQPMYYDPAKEDLQNRINKYKPAEQGEPDIEKNKQNIRDVFRAKQSGAYYRNSSSKMSSDSNMRLLKVIGVLAIITVLILRSDAVLNIVSRLSGK